MNIKYKKVAESPDVTKVARFDVIEKTAVNPSIILLFITATFGGIASFLPLHAVEQNVAGIEFYFIVYAAFLMLSRVFARSEEHTSELQSRFDLVCCLLLVQ